MTDRTLDNRPVDLRRERVRRNLDALAAELRCNPALAERTLAYLDGNDPGEDAPGEHTQRRGASMADKTDLDRELLTAPQCAEYLSVTIRHVYALHRESGLPLFKLRREWRIFKADLVAWLQERKRQTGRPGRKAAS